MLPTPQLTWEVPWLQLSWLLAWLCRTRPTPAVTSPQVCACRCSGQRVIIHWSALLSTGVHFVGLQLYQATAASANNSAARHNYGSGSVTCSTGTQVTADCSGDASGLYKTTTFNDFAFWAAAWAFRATGDTGYLIQAQTFQQRFIQGEAAANLQ